MPTLSQETPKRGKKIKAAAVPATPAARRKAGIPDFPWMGPRQSAYVRALQSGKYPRTALATFDGTNYDPLGIACELAGAKRSRLKTGHYTYDKVVGVMPPSVVAYYNFRGPRGEHRSSKYFADQDWKHSILKRAITVKTFNDLARIIISNPKAYFTKKA